jgi:hypothetical protein
MTDGRDFDAVVPRLPKKEQAMTVFNLKVKQNPEGGHGENLGIREVSLGIFAKREDAERAQEARRQSISKGFGPGLSCAGMFDVGPTWIVEEYVQ